jgi:hypothetical protein
MTAKVFEFKKPPETKPKETIPARRAALTDQEIFQDTTEDILGEWQERAIKNQLNEFIVSKIPSYARGLPDSDHVNDLNVISNIEQKLEMKVALFYPGCTPANPYGWMAAFHRGKDVFTTPPEMASEANARALNILLCLSLDFHLKALGR